MNEDIYDYPSQYKFIALAAPLLIISSTIYLVLWPFLRSEPLSSHYFLVLVAGLPLATVFAISIHFTYPTVVVRQGGFKLKTQLYESKWYNWGQLTRIRQPATGNFVTQLYVIGCNDFDIWFLIIGYSQGVFTKGFLIHPNMRHAERLLRLILKERPELFE